MPRPALVCEIAETHVAFARDGQFAADALPAGLVLPSAVEPNLPDPAALGARLEPLLQRLGSRGPEVALLLPDQVIRVFLLHFDSFPRRADEAIPLLRWRLKKSVPFDVEDTVVSYMPQPLMPSHAAGVSVLAAVARQRVVRQYEEVVEGLGLRPGVAMSSSLATLPLVDPERPALLARLCGTTLVTLVARGEALCVYRCTESAPAASLATTALLEELYPAVAFFQDNWRENISEVRLSGLGSRFEEFRHAVEVEIGGRVQPLLSGAAARRLPVEARGLVEKQYDALVGWTVARSA
jgi:type IV pilus assembly protein PilM